MMILFRTIFKDVLPIFFILISEKSIVSSNPHVEDGNWSVFILNLNQKIDLYENNLAVGSIFDDDYADNAGSVYIYTFDGNQWLFNEKIYANVNEEDNNFGRSVSLFENILAVSCINADVEYINLGLVDILVLHSKHHH